MSDKAGYDIEKARRVRPNRLGKIGLLTMNAREGNVEPLMDYLLSDQPLSDEDRKWLAWLVERQRDQVDDLGPRPRGRPPGPPHSLGEAMTCAEYLVISWKRIWRAREHRKRVPRTISKIFVREALKLVNKRFPRQRGKIIADDIERRVGTNRGRSSSNLAKEMFPDRKTLMPI